MKRVELLLNEQASWKSNTSLTFWLAHGFQLLIGEERGWIYRAFYLSEEEINHFAKDCDYTHPLDSGGRESSHYVWVRPWGLLLDWVQHWRQKMQVKQNQVPECFGLKDWHRPISSPPGFFAFHQLKGHAQNSFTGCAKNGSKHAQEKPHFQGGYNQDEILATV